MITSTDTEKASDEIQNPFTKKKKKKKTITKGLILMCT
jgi:hypothetical protein